MLTVYLAGPIAGCTDIEAHGWRDRVIEQLAGKMSFRNPMLRDYRKPPFPKPASLVRADLADIIDSDVVLVNGLMGPSWGTAQEMVYARMLNKKVIFVCGHLPISPWVSYHADIVFASLDSAILALSTLAGD